jgi:hypothetical protein
MYHCTVLSHLPSKDFPYNGAQPHSQEERHNFSVDKDLVYMLRNRNYLMENINIGLYNHIPKYLLYHDPDKEAYLLDNDLVLIPVYVLLLSEKTKI